MTRSSGRVCSAATLMNGAAEGTVVVLDAPLSLWGGMDPATGVVIDRHHPQCGAGLSGRILVMPWGRGSSSSSSVLTEAIRAGTAPAGVVLAEPDEIVVLGALVADELYGVTIPVVVMDGDGYGRLRTGDRVHIAGDPGGASLEWVGHVNNAHPPPTRPD